MTDESRPPQDATTDETTPPQDDAAAPQAPPAAAPPQVAPRPAPRLVRRPEGKIIAGVCSGLEAYTGIDAVAWRIGFVVLALSGAGVLAYIVAWIVMPMARPGETVPAERPGLSAQSGRWVAIALIVFGLLLLSRNIFEFRGGIFWAVLLIGIGIAIWGRDLAPRSTDAPAPPPPAGPPPVPASDAPTDVSPTWPGSAAPTTPIPPAPPAWPTATSPVPAPSPRDPRSRREPSILGRLVVGAAALAVGIGLVIESAGVDMSAKLYIQILLWIVGAGLIIGTWWGRARWLVFPGLVLCMCLATIALVPFPGPGGFGQTAWHPRSVAEIEQMCRSASPGAPCFTQTAGEAVLDLTDVDFTQDEDANSFVGKDNKVDVRLGFGELLIVVPEDVNVAVEAHVQGGEINLFGELDNGWDIDAIASAEGKEGVGPLNLEAQVTFGELRVIQGEPGDVSSFIDDNPRGRGFDFNFDFEREMRGR